VTLEEMQAAQAAVAAALEARREFSAVEALPFVPGDLPEVAFMLNGDDLVVTVGVC
jgi:hypothetical protein